MKKPQKKHLFARTCRVLGRFLLALGAVLCLASVIIACAPLIFQEKGTEFHPTYEVIELDSSSASHEITSTVRQIANPAPYILPAVAISVFIVIALLLVFRSYNATIRNIIARIAKKTNVNIHSTELILATLIWTIVNLVFIFNAPVFAILSFAAMIINNLFFIFAWTSYGCPVYSI
jgi:hypothetical protein